ncbi:MAG: tetratricopeptide repeat protein [Proteobacteria bacterium]|nr:tetratricopeptide repeat protein [Pseudomonadota bacterium]
MLPSPKRIRNAMKRLGAIAMLTLALTACRNTPIDFTASIAGQGDLSEAGLKRQADALGRAYDRKPGEKVVSLRYAQVLRQLGQHAQAVAVLQRASVANLNDTDVSAAYGKTLVDVGRYREAGEVLSRAHTPDRPNWRVLSAQGTVADQMGDHVRAQQFYENALQVSPGEPTVLANLGLSYALSRRLGDAERVLRQAAADPRADNRVRANLALVLALSGKFNESETVARKDLAPREAEANVQGIRKMISQTNTWAEIQKAELDRKKK